MFRIGSDWIDFVLKYNKFTKILAEINVTEFPWTPHKALAYISKGPPHHHRIEDSLLNFFKFVPLFADFIIGITFVDVNGHTSSLMVYFICWKQLKMCIIVLQKLLSFINFQITSYCSHFSFIRTVAVKYDITRWNLN